MPHLLIVGGSTRHKGGAELFVERASTILRRRGWTLDHLKTNSAFLRPASLPTYVRSLSALLFRRRRSDCAWVQYGSLPDLAFVVAARLRGYHVFVTPHLGASARSLAGGVLARWSRLALKAAHHLLLISRSQEIELDLSGLPRTYIRTFLPEESLGQHAPVDRAGAELRLVHAARLSEAKGSFLVVDICARLRDQGVPFTATIIGGAEPEVLERLQRSIEAQALTGQVRLVGELPVGGVVEQLRQSDVLIHLSRQDSYPLVVLEALAAGALPLCLDLPGARNMVEQYDGQLVSHDRPAEAAADLLARLDLADIRRRGRDAAVRVQQDLDWSRSGEALEDALRDCSGSAGQQAALQPG